MIAKISYPFQEIVVAEFIGRIEFYFRLTPVAMVTNFGTKIAITRLT